MDGVGKTQQGRHLCPYRFRERRIPTAPFSEGRAQGNRLRRDRIRILVRGPLRGDYRLLFLLHRHRVLLLIVLPPVQLHLIVIGGYDPVVGLLPCAPLTILRCIYLGRTSPATLRSKGLSSGTIRSPNSVR